MKTRLTPAHAFSMIELVIVIVIIGIIAAIAIPRMSRGTAGAATGALQADLAVLRNAIELYTAEHDGNAPGATIVAQLTTHTNSAGTTQATKDAAHPYGPYIKAIPSLPVGTNKGHSTVTVETNAATTAPDATSMGGGEGWWYNSVLVDIRANVDGSAANQNDLDQTFNGF